MFYALRSAFGSGNSSSQELNMTVVADMWTQMNAHFEDVYALGNFVENHDQYVQLTCLPATARSRETASLWKKKEDMARAELGSTAADPVVCCGRCVPRTRWLTAVNSSNSLALFRSAQAWSIMSPGSQLLKTDTHREWASHRKCSASLLLSGASADV